MMSFIKLSQILPPAIQQRSTLEQAPLQSLGESIKTVGLIQPIVVIQRDNAYEIIAGERRYRCFTEYEALASSLGITPAPLKIAGNIIPTGTIPAIVVSKALLDSMSKVDVEVYLYKVQFEENCTRQDLSLSDKALALAQLASLTAKQMSEKKQQEALKNPPTNPPKDVRETTLLPVTNPAVVKAVGALVSPTPTTPKADKANQTLIAAGQALLNPRTPDNVKSALKAATTVTALNKTLELAAQRAEYEKKSKDISQTIARDHIAIKGDCTVELPKLPDKSFYGVISDPIYGVGADKFGNSDGQSNPQLHNYDDSYETWQKLMPIVLKQMSRLVMNNGFLFLFCDIQRFYELVDYVKEADSTWVVYNRPVIIFQDTQGARVPYPNQSPRRQYQVALMAWRQNFIRQSDLWDVIVAPKSDKEAFGANKPVALLEKIIKALVPVGATILDPFGGTGSIIEAAFNCGVKTTVIEIAEAQYGRILERIEATNK